jgi:hypothetical protein
MSEVEIRGVKRNQFLDSYIGVAIGSVGIPLERRCCKFRVPTS